MRFALCLVLLLSPISSWADDDDDWPTDQAKLEKDVKAVKDDKATAANSTMPPPERDEAKRDLPKRYDDIEQIADRHKENPVAQEKVAEAYLDVDEPKRAVPHADQFVELARKKDDPAALGRALDLRSGVKLTLHDYKAAAADAREALAKKPDDETARRLLALAQSKGVGDVNLSKLKKAETPDSGASAPGKAAAPSAGADGRASGKQDAQVLSDARQTAELRAQAAAHDDAQRFLSLGDFPAAIKAINISLEKHPQSAPLLALRSQAQLGAGKTAEAMADAQAAVLAGPKLPEARIARAKAGEAFNAPAVDVLADYAAAKELDPRFTADYESALARMGGSSNPNVDANGIGTMGRRGLGFNPAAARQQLFGRLPEPWRSLAPVLIIALVAAIVALATWLFSRYGGRS